MSVSNGFTYFLCELARNRVLLSASQNGSRIIKYSSAHRETKVLTDDANGILKNLQNKYPTKKIAASSVFANFYWR